jgi:hypothetical protein
MSLWYARGNIKEMLRSAIKGEYTEDEVFSPRTAIFGGIVGFILLVIFSNVFLFATPLGASLWLIFFLTGVLALARLRAQAGLPVQSGVQDPSIPLFGGSNLTDGNIWYNGKMGIFSGERFFPSIGQEAVDQYKMAEQVGMRKASMTKALIMSVAFAAVICMVIGLPYIHQKGGFMFAGHYTTNMHRHLNWVWTWAEHFAKPSFKVISRFFVGLFGVVGLSVLHSQYMWWPIHPVGWATMTLMRTFQIWGSFLIAWFLKSVTLRWGGIQAYRKISPVFIGLILGSAIGQIFWIFLDVIM